jgi:hypothetical protein
MAISRGFYHAPAKPGLSATTGSFSWSLRPCAPSDPTRVQRRQVRGDDADHALVAQRLRLRQGRDVDHRQVREGRVSDSCTRTLAYEPWLPSRT